jgi:nicotinamide-nucleotide amidase
MITPALVDDAASLLDACRARRVRIATAESLTGGLIAAALTTVAGSSDVMERGFVAYSNEAKAEMLGVPSELIASVGAVSEPVAQRMAQGALAHSRADIAVAVVGLAGPGGGSAVKPIGQVWFGVARRGKAVVSEHQVFPGDRTAIREAAVARAFALIRDAL